MFFSNLFVKNVVQDLTSAGGYCLPKDTKQEYVDDGYSGTSTSRPAFQRLIQDAQDGNIGEECNNMDNSTQEKFTVSRLMWAVNYGKMEAQ